MKKVFYKKILKVTLLSIVLINKVYANPWIAEKHKTAFFLDLAQIDSQTKSDIDEKKNHIVELYKILYNLEQKLKEEMLKESIHKNSNQQALTAAINAIREDINDLNQFNTLYDCSLMMEKGYSERYSYGIKISRSANQFFAKQNDFHSEIFFKIKLFEFKKKHTITAMPIIKTYTKKISKGAGIFYGRKGYIKKCNAHYFYVLGLELMDFENKDKQELSTIVSNGIKFQKNMLDGFFISNYTKFTVSSNQTKSYRRYLYSNFAIGKTFKNNFSISFVKSLQISAARNFLRNSFVGVKLHFQL